MKIKINFPTFNYRYHKRRRNHGHQWSNCVRSGYDVSGKCAAGRTAIEHDDEVRFSIFDSLIFILFIFIFQNLFDFYKCHGNI